MRSQEQRCFNQSLRVKENGSLITMLFWNACVRFVWRAPVYMYDLIFCLVRPMIPAFVADGRVQIYDPRMLPPLLIGCAMAPAVSSLMPVGSEHKIQLLTPQKVCHSRDSGYLVLAWMTQRLLRPQDDLRLLQFDSDAFRGHVVRSLDTNECKPFPHTQLTMEVKAAPPPWVQILREPNDVIVRAEQSSSRTALPPDSQVSVLRFCCCLPSISDMSALQIVQTLGPMKSVCNSISHIQQPNADPKGANDSGVSKIDEVSLLYHPPSPHTHKKPVTCLCHSLRCCYL